VKTLSARSLLSRRPAVPDTTLLDALDLWLLLDDSPGTVETARLCSLWEVSRSSVSRRIARIANNHLADITSVWGGYQVHEFMIH
jgi:hypothetical protein